MKSRVRRREDDGGMRRRVSHLSDDDTDGNNNGKDKGSCPGGPMARGVIAGLSLATLLYMAFFRTAGFGDMSAGLTMDALRDGELKVATWNMAAINNNPFEYWISHEDPRCVCTPPPHMHLHATHSTQNAHARFTHT